MINTSNTFQLARNFLKDFQFQFAKTTQVIKLTENKNHIF